MSTQDQILAELGKLGLATPRTISERIGITRNSAKVTMWRMAKAGVITTHDATGAYYIPNPRRSTITVPVDLPEREAA